MVLRSGNAMPSRGRLEAGVEKAVIQMSAAAQQNREAERKPTPLGVLKLDTLLAEGTGQARGPLARCHSTLSSHRGRDPSSAPGSAPQLHLEVGKTLACPLTHPIPPSPVGKCRVTRKRTSSPWREAALQPPTAGKSTSPRFSWPVVPVSVWLPAQRGCCDAVRVLRGANTQPQW